MPTDPTASQPHPAPETEAQVDPRALRAARGIAAQLGLSHAKPAEVEIIAAAYADQTAALKQARRALALVDDRFAYDSRYSSTTGAMIVKAALTSIDALEGK